MSRTPKPTDFRVPVPDVGDFIFAKRTMRDEIATQVEYARMIDGVTPTAWLEVVCGAIADLTVLTVKAPDGWDLETMDPHDPAVFTKLIAAHRGLRDQEISFRQKSGKAEQAPGA